ncbi:MAG: hypothetical protein LBD17_04085 [Endomicrobium sp.]|jgi:hypothetical protein|nr:hypothetical protein [Endomicrobium sp.]
MKIKKILNKKSKKVEFKMNKKEHILYPSLVMEKKIKPITVFNIKSEDFSLVFFNKQDLIDFVMKSGDLDTEYQCNYYALVQKYIVGDRNLYITIPILYYNYKQEVTGSSISFALEDMYGKEYEVNIKNLKKSKFYKYIRNFTSIIGGQLENENITKINTIHRHPSGVLRFSSTDYDKNIEEPSVVFHLEKAVNAPTTASVLIRNPIYVPTTETRIANGDISKRMEYHQLNTISITYGNRIKHNTNILFELFGLNDENILVSNDNKNLYDLFSNIPNDYKANTDFINKENIHEKKYEFTGFQTNFGNRSWDWEGFDYLEKEEEGETNLNEKDKKWLKI